MDVLPKESLLLMPCMRVPMWTRYGEDAFAVARGQLAKRKRSAEDTLAALEVRRA